MKQITQKQVKTTIYNEYMFKDAKIIFKACEYDKTTKMFYIYPSNDNFIAWGTLKTGLVCLNGHVGMCEIHALSRIEARLQEVLYELQ